VESVDQVGRQQDHQCIDDKKKQAQGDDGDGEGNDLQHQPQSRVEQADDERRDQRRLQAAHLKARQEMGNNQQSNRTQQPVNQELEHSVSLLELGLRRQRLDSPGPIDA
jgi:hypothetical protein